MKKGVNVEDKKVEKERKRDKSKKNLKDPKATNYNSFNEKKDDDSKPQETALLKIHQVYI